MGPKPQLKGRHSTLHEYDQYGGREEFSDGGMSQDEESYIPHASEEPTTSQAIPRPNKPRVEKRDTSRPSLIRPGTHTPRVSHKSVNTDIVSLNQDRVLTRVFIIQWLIGVFTFVLCAIVFSLYFNQIQLIYLKESLNGILNVTESGQTYIDATINKEMSVRVPVLMSNSTPTVIDKDVTKWVDNYISESLSRLVRTYIQAHYKSMVEEKCESEVNRLVDEVVFNAQTAETLLENVKSRTLAKITSIINEISPQLIKKQIDEELKGIIEQKMRTYIDQQLTDVGPEAVKSEMESEKVKLMLDESLSDGISKRVFDMSPQLIEKYTGHDTVIDTIDNKLKELLEKQLGRIDMKTKVDEELVKGQLSQQITKIAEDIIDKESLDQANSKIKKKFDDIIEKYKPQADQFQSDLEENKKNMESELKEADEFLRKMKTDSGALKSILARQDKQANLLVLLSGVVIGLLLCVFYLYQRTTRKGNMELPIVPQRDLGQKACIILFSDKVREDIRKLVEDLKMPHFGYEFCVITREADIAKLPKCKVFMMCCEFTERHVIIEEKGLGLGNLHRKTYERAMEINGKLIILYIHDPGSRDIFDKHYNKDYNEKIHCVNGQPELSGLRDKGCFFSCDKKLSDFQIKKLQERLSE